MSDVRILAIDLAKRSFQICATSPGGAVLFNRTVLRAKLDAKGRSLQVLIAETLNDVLSKYDETPMGGVGNIS